MNAPGLARTVLTLALPVTLVAVPLLQEQGGPVVEAISPVSHSLSPETQPPVVARFDRPIDPASIDDAVISVFGRWSGVVSGKVHVADAGRELRFVPDRPFMKGEMVTASVSRLLIDADGQPMASAYTWSFWIRADPASLDLVPMGQLTTKRPNEAKVQSYGAYAGDLNGDGFSDLAVPNEIANDVRLFFNDGAGNYKDFTILDYPDGAVPSPNEGADFNRDGIIDFAVGNAGNRLVSFFMGEGDGKYTHTYNVTADRGVRGVCILDVNGDGWPDIATANMNGDRRRGNISLLINRGMSGEFESRNIASPGRSEKTCATGDANEDGIIDLFVGAFNSREVLLFLGDGNGGLEYSAKFPVDGKPWMVVSGDVNGDGHVDILTANRSKPNMSVLLGDGAGQLSPPVLYDAGDESLAIDVGDVDGDGDLDAITSNLGSKNFTLFENLGDGTFGNPRFLPAGRAGSCAIVHDRDGDGDLDITGVDEVDDMIFLFRNDKQPTEDP